MKGPFVAGTKLLPFLTSPQFTRSKCVIADFNAAMQVHWDFKACDCQLEVLARFLDRGSVAKVVLTASCGAICAMVEDSKTIISLYIYICKAGYSILTSLKGTKRLGLLYVLVGVSQNL